MKVAVIVPVPLLKRYGDLSDAHLVLAHLVLNDKKYRDFYLRMSRNGDLVILDNSTIELNTPLDWDQIRAAGDAVEATEVVLPDVVGDALTTARNLMRYGGTANYRRTVFIPQGGNLVQWHWCLGVGYGQNEFRKYDTLGIPKSVESRFNTPRWGVVRTLLKMELLPNGKSLHLFGVHNNPSEILRYDGIQIRSIDLKFPVWAGQIGLTINKGGTAPGSAGLERDWVIQRIGKDPSLDLYSDIDTPEIARNIKTVLGWGREHDRSLRVEK